MGLVSYKNEKFQLNNIMKFFLIEYNKISKKNINFIK
jgi:hypothetical protein